MSAESFVSPSSAGSPLLIGLAAAAGTLLLDVLNSPVFARSLGAIVTLLLILSAAWESWKNKRSRRQDEQIASLRALEENNRSVIEGLLQAGRIAKVERESMLLRLDRASLDLAQAKLEILRNKGVVAYSGQRIPLRPLTPPSRINILLVEDDESTRRGFMKVIGHYGYQITATETVAEALEQIRNRERAGPKFDFAILDLILPDGSGIEVLGALQASSPATDAIVISGSIDEVVLAKTQSEAVAFLVKPVEFTELLTLIGYVDDNAAGIKALEQRAGDAA